MIKSVYCFVCFDDCVIKVFNDINAAEKYSSMAEEYYIKETGRTPYVLGSRIVEYHALFRTELDYIEDKAYPKTVYLVSLADYASRGGCLEMVFEELDDAAEFAEFLKCKTFTEEFLLLSEEDLDELMKDPDELKLILSMFRFGEAQPGIEYSSF